jgi:hypothetical protein
MADQREPRPHPSTGLSTLEAADDPRGRAARWFSPPPLPHTPSQGCLANPFS